MSHNQDEQGESSDRWLVSYADFMTLLFAFFAVLYATSEINLEKTKQFEESVKKFVIKLGAAGESGAKFDDGNKFNTPIDQPVKTFPTSEKSHMAMQMKIETFVEEQLDKEEVKKRIAEINQEDLGVRISMIGERVFTPGSTQIRRESLDMLNKMAELFRQNGKKILVESHLRPGAADPLNGWDLTSQRSSAIVRYFVKVHKIDAKRFVSLGYSDSEPENGTKLDFLILPEAFPF